MPVFAEEIKKRASLKRLQSNLAVRESLSAILHLAFAVSFCPQNARKLRKMFLWGKIKVFWKERRLFLAICLCLVWRLTENRITSGIFLRRPLSVLHDQFYIIYTLDLRNLWLRTEEYLRFCELAVFHENICRVKRFLREWVTMPLHRKWATLATSIRCTGYADYLNSSVLYRARRNFFITSRPMGIRQLTLRKCCLIHLRNGGAFVGWNKWKEGDS